MDYQETEFHQPNVVMTLVTVTPTILLLRGGVLGTWEGTAALEIKLSMFGC